VKLGIIGTGNVGNAIALAAATRGSAREIVLVNRTRKVAEAVATDLRYGIPLGPRIDISDGDYDALNGAGVVLITSGVNEKTGGATDRSDPQGRLRLLEKNAAIYRDIVPRIVSAAPQAVLVAVTDPPDPLADIARNIAGHDRVLSTGTLLDSLRFRVHLGAHFGVDPRNVEAQVVGDHGTSQVFLWSSARVAGVPLATLLQERGENLADLRAKVEKGRALRQHHYHRRPRGEPVRNRYRISPHCRNGAPRRAQRDPDRQLPTRIWRHAVLAERCWSRRRDDDFASRPVCRGEKWIGEKRREFAHSAKRVTS
jgi:malate/lactate dehydrogenase